MFFGYPVAATQDNWFHECVCQAVRTIHVLADTNQRYPLWPRVLPANRRDALRRRTKLNDLLKAYYVALRQLSKSDRDRVLVALVNENRIPELLSGVADCDRKNQLSPSIQEPIVQLFTYSFGILGELDLRTTHYTTIYEQMTAQLCPFCGISYFRNPDQPQEDLDHYLNRHIYPFAAANLRNLVPMCHECNSKYKLEADMVRRGDGSRRVAFDPYDCTTVVRVLVDESKPFLGVGGLQAWRVKLDPETPEVKTWDEVFSVCERYRQNHLERGYKVWVDKFVRFARKEMGLYSDERLIDMLRSYEQELAQEGLGDRAFLKAAVFRMLRLHCEAGSQEALDHLREWIYPPNG